MLKPFLRGRDVKRWSTNFADYYLIQIESSENKQHPWANQTSTEAERIFARTYPSVHSYFEGFRDKLIKRSDQGRYFWELRSCAYWQEFEQVQIAWGNLSTKPNFSFVEAGIYLSAPATFMVSDSSYLLGILNSQVMHYFISRIAAVRQGGFLEFKPMYVSQISIPKASSADQKIISALVQKCLNAKGQNLTEWEAEINDRVAHLYGLTAEEIKIIEGEQN